MPRIVLIAAAILLLSTGTSFAYLDPGTGSFLLQALIGALVSAAAFLGLFKQKIRDFWARVFHKRSSDQP